MNHVKSTVDPQEINKFSQHAKYWWDANGPLKTLHDINPARLDFINQHTSLAGVTVLDVGCGGGVLSEAMARKGAHTIGIDAAFDAIEVAKEHAKNNQISIEYMCTPIEEYEHPGFDVITCMEMLEHVPNPEVVLEHCKRLLKPDGTLFLSTISRTVKAYAHAILGAEYILGILPKQTHDYSKFIKPSELIAMCRSWGFNLVDMQGMQYNPVLRTASLSDDVRVNYLLALR